MKKITGRFSPAQWHPSDKYGQGEALWTMKVDNMWPSFNYKSY